MPNSALSRPDGAAGMANDREGVPGGDPSGAVPSAPDESLERAAARARELLVNGELTEAAVLAERARSEGTFGRLVWIDVALARGELAAAWGETQALLDELREAHGEVHPDVARALDRLAAVRLGLGALAEGLALAERAVAIAEVLAARANHPGYDVVRDGSVMGPSMGPKARVVCGLDSSEEADLRHTRAEALHRLGRYGEARAAWREVLRRRRAVLRLDHPDLAATDDAIGLTLCRLGEPTRALRHHQAAAAVWAEMLPHHPGRAANLHAQGQALRRLGRLREARERMQLAVEVTEIGVGADHADTWISRFELGHIELDLGEITEGLARMRAALSVLEHRLGPMHPTVEAMRGLL